jgi:hypothetical protein
MLMGINVIPINVLVQLIDIFIILVDGPNTENKFIIFSSVFLFISFFFFCNSCFWDM